GSRPADSQRAAAAPGADRARRRPVTEMLDFRGTSIRRKLTRAMMLTSSVALLVASAFFAVYDAMTVRTRLERDLSTLATIIGSNCKAALTFAGGESDAETILGALDAKPHVVAAAIYGPD